MIDWNGNGKIDPVDIGISLSLIEETEKPHKKKGGGCLSSVIIMLSAIGCFIWLVGSVFI